MESNIAGYLTGNTAVWAEMQLSEIILALINLALVGAVVVCFFLLIIGGSRWITSGSDKEQLASAQKTLTAAIVGLVIVFSAWAILSLVRNFFGLEEGPMSVNVSGG